MKLLKELPALVETRIATFDRFSRSPTVHRKDVGHRYTSSSRRIDREPCVAREPTRWTNFG